MAASSTGGSSPTALDPRERKRRIRARRRARRDAHVLSVRQPVLAIKRHASPSMTDVNHRDTEDTEDARRITLATPGCTPAAWVHPIDCQIHSLCVLRVLCVSVVDVRHPSQSLSRDDVRRHLAAARGHVGQAAGAEAREEAGELAAIQVRRAVHQHVAEDGAFPGVEAREQLAPHVDLLLHDPRVVLPAERAADGG